MPLACVICTKTWRPVRLCSLTLLLWFWFCSTGLGSSPVARDGSIFSSVAPCSPRRRQSSRPTAARAASSTTRKVARARNWTSLRVGQRRRAGHFACICREACCARWSRESKAARQLGKIVKGNGGITTCSSAGSPPRPTASSAGSTCSSASITARSSSGIRSSLRFSWSSEKVRACCTDNLMR